MHKNLFSLFGVLCFFVLSTELQSDELASFEKSFLQLFPSPPVLANSETLFRFDEAKKRAYLNNISEVRDISSTEGDKHWEIGDDSNVYRSTYFGRPGSTSNYEYWTRTAMRPKKGEFNNNDVMRADEIVLFQKEGPQNDMLEFRSINFKEGYYIFCQESPSKNPPVSGTLSPFACLYADRETCSIPAKDLTDKTLLAQVMSHQKEIAGIVSKVVSAKWTQIDEFFRGTSSYSPGLSSTVDMGNFTPVEKNQLKTACELLAKTDSKKTVDQNH